MITSWTSATIAGGAWASSTKTRAVASLPVFSPFSAARRLQSAQPRPWLGFARPPSHLVQRKLGTLARVDLPLLSVSLDSLLRLQRPTFGTAYELLPVAF